MSLLPILKIFTHFSSVFIVDFEQVNICRIKAYSLKTQSVILIAGTFSSDLSIRYMHFYKTKPDVRVTIGI